MASSFHFDHTILPEPMRTRESHLHLRNTSLASTASDGTYFGGTSTRPPSDIDLLSRHNTLQENAQTHLWQNNGAFSVAGDPLTLDDLKWEREKWLKERLRRWTIWRNIAGSIVYVWSIYTTVRYYVAYSVYRDDSLRQKYALALGTTSAFSAIILSANFAFQLCRRRPSSLAPFFRYSVYMSSAALFGTAVVNVVLVALWRYPNEPSQMYRSVEGRCGWDIDVVWSGTGGQCSTGDATPWRSWLAGSITRLVVTIAGLVIFHLTLLRYTRISRPAKLSSSTLVNSADVVPTGAEIRPLRSSRERISIPPMAERGTSTVGSAAIPASYFDQKRSQYAEPESPCSPGIEEPFVPRVTHSPSRTFSEEDALQSFVSNLRELVQLAASEEAREFGLSMHEPETVEVVGGYVRRMSTIESLGSREYTSDCEGTHSSRATGGARYASAAAQTP